MLVMEEAVIAPLYMHGVVGESGSGKTTIGRSIIRLHTPTSGSVTFQGKEIAGKMDAATCAYLFIAHDLSMVKYISDRIGVLHLGYLVETGTADEIFANPVHPYTKSLLSAVPIPNPMIEKQRHPIIYDQKAQGVDYAAGTEHVIEGTHKVLATDEELARWTA